MSCEKCKGTDCIVSDSFELRDGTRIFADLRFDLENNELDINFGTLDNDGYAKESGWSHSCQIKFCPFCGIELPKV